MKRHAITVAARAVLILAAVCCLVRSSHAETKLETAVLPGLKQTLAVDLGGGMAMEFVLIRPGTFTMGDGNDAHKVTLTKPFYIGKYEVTQEQWERVMGSNPSNFKGAKNPVEQVSWEDCQNFLAKLKEKAPGTQFSLPTEAQWEYACRAGTATDPGNWDEVAWYSNNSGSKTHPVGEKKPNAWGLYDMHGNVWEWCADWYGANSSSAQTAPTGPASGQWRVLRGGSWNYYPDNLRASYRINYYPAIHYYGIGVRCVVLVGGASAR